MLLVGEAQVSSDNCSNMVANGDTLKLVREPNYLAKWTNKCQDFMGHKRSSVLMFKDINALQSINQPNLFPNTLAS